MQMKKNNMQFFCNHNENNTPLNSKGRFGQKKSLKGATQNGPTNEKMHIVVIVLVFLSKKGSWTRCELK